VEFIVTVLGLALASSSMVILVPSINTLSFSKTLFADKTTYSASGGAVVAHAATRPGVTVRTMPDVPIPNAPHVFAEEAESKEPLAKAPIDVPPCPAANVPPSVIVPLVVMGPPLAVMPVEPPET
jgi:hypothetical protein